jgi:hypothetical protein
VLIPILFSFLFTFVFSATDASELSQEECPGVFSFDMLSPAFCAAFMRDMHAFEASDQPKQRPNSMNNYGLWLAFDDYHMLALYWMTLPSLQ